MNAVRPVNGGVRSTAAEVERFLEKTEKYRWFSPIPYEIAGDYYLGQKNADAAELHYRKALSLDEERPAIHRRLREIALQRGDREAAQKELQRMRELFPSNPDYQKLQ